VFKKIIFGILLNAGALYGVIYFLPEITYTGGVKFFVIGGVTMGVINSIIKPILKLITLPLQIITLGLSLILLNGVIFWIFTVFIDTIVVPGVTIQVHGIITHLFAGLIFGLINWLANLIIR